MLVGPSGCGKTTLISVIAVSWTTTKGNAWFFSRMCGAWGRHRNPLPGANIGFVFQAYNLIPPSR